jgi:acyl-CoA synthetase (NDP forming)
MNSSERAAKKLPLILSRDAKHRESKDAGQQQEALERRSMAYDKVTVLDKATAHGKAAVRTLLAKVKAEGRTALTAPEGKLICAAYGIAVPKEAVATSAKEAASLARKIGFPVVMKIVSPDILHKTEAGGVVVGVKTPIRASANWSPSASAASWSRC